MTMFSCRKELPTMMNTEDFSFPVICNNPLSTFMLSATSQSSSSLWRISSKVYHLSDDEQGETENEYQMEVRSLCEEILPSRRELLSCSSFRREDVSVEESMDYLWQDFNEEEEMCKMGLKSSGNNKQKMCIIQGTKLGRRPVSKLIIGKLLKGLLSFRKPSH